MRKDWTFSKIYSWQKETKKNELTKICTLPVLYFFLVKNLILVHISNIHLHISNVMTFPFNSMILNRLVFPFLFNCHTCNTNDVCKLLCLKFFFINSKAVCVSKYLLRLVDDSWIHVQFFIKRYGVPSFCFVLAFFYYLLIF